ncbi:glutathione-regulated potassium-efflux system ancillary protein KefG [Vibrio maritimus]|uniref:Glutathione-regulated potassium-efflux system ancillary protein KefG n=1 Tax=Vibrio maritimus TaxID=990268 RepID=A0A090S3P0_9VIBR|nr:glutathione-regulated potassium-efflux system ancillary protein KefG [Vibrio maritimus]
MTSELQHSNQSPKVLVIYAHPEPQNSIANQVMLKKSILG